MKKIIILLFIPLFAKPQSRSKATIQGVITFFFNKYQGDKPDIGSQVYVIDSASAKKIDQKILDSFEEVNTYRHIAEKYKQMNMDVPPDVLYKMGECHADDDSYFRDLDGRNYAIFLNVKSSDNAIRSVVDASGSYSLSAKPGTYFVFIKSNNRTDMSVSEITGQMFFRKIRVKADQTVNVSTKFDLK